MIPVKEELLKEVDVLFDLYSDAPDEESKQEVLTRAFLVLPAIVGLGEQTYIEKLNLLLGV